MGSPNSNPETKEEVSPEMLQNLELLLDLDTIENESEWEQLENLDSAESSSTEESK